MRKHDKITVGGASAVLTEIAKGCYSLSSVYSKRLGQGDGRRLMEEITDYADERGAEISLVVKRYGYPRGEGLNNRQLVEFYQKFGFQLDSTYGDGTHKKMVRSGQPREKNMPHNERDENSIPRPH